MNAEQLSTFEQLATEVFNPTSTTEQQNAKEALKMFESNPLLTPQLKHVLDNSASPQAQVYAAMCLNTLVTWKWNSFKLGTRIDIRHYVLQVLADRGPTLEGLLRTQLLTLLAKITKMGWFDGGDDSIHQKTVDQVHSFFQPGSPHHSLIGLAILTTLLEEIGSHSTAVSLTLHRKIALAFRDTALLKIFKLSITTLRAIDSGNISPAEKEVAPAITASGLKLATLCLTFDFVGTNPVESTEDHAVLKIPATWKPTFEEGNGVALLQLFWNLFNKSRGVNRTNAMAIIVELASVRRSLFTDDDHRAMHLGSLMNGITDTLTAWENDHDVLGDDDTLHHFCRLLARLKGNFQLSQIVNAESYSDWIRLVGSFSLTQDWSNQPNPHFYVMMLWSRLVSAIPYLESTRSRAVTTGLLEKFAPKVLATFVRTRLDAVRFSVEDSPHDDPLPEEEAAMLSQLDALPALGRLKYMECAAALEQDMAGPAQVYAQTRVHAQGSADLACAEGQLALLVLVISAIFTRSSHSSSSQDAHHEIDAVLGARVLKIMRAHDSALEQDASKGASWSFSRATKRLELSLLSFLTVFRGIYIGDVSMSTTMMFKKLAEVIGVADSQAMLDLVVHKVILNLRVWAGEPDVIAATTKLFTELVTGYASIRLIVKLPAAVGMLGNHTAEHFPFLSHPSNHRSRVRFYMTLAKLLYMKSDGASSSDQMDVTPEQMYAEFCAPMSQRLEFLAQHRSDMAVLRSSEAYDMILGTLLDLRGMASGVYSRKAYERLFDWVYPRYSPVLLAAAKVWADTPAVLQALLKFWQEFCTNRSSRIVFDVSSANGILLFKETSTLLVTVGEAVASMANVSISESDLYAAKYKTVMLSLTVLTVALQGGYCNFGVFSLYQDPALTNAVATGFELALGVPLDHVVQYPKLTLAYFAFVDRIAAHHIEYVCMLPRAQFTRLLESLDTGITYPVVAVSTQVCATLDALASYAKKYVDEPNPPEAWSALCEHVSELRDGFLTAFNTLIHFTLFGQCENQWSCSRPLLSLAMILPGAFDQYSQSLIAKQPEANRLRLSECFAELMNGVANNLAYKTRDQFTQNLQQFKSDINKFVTMEASI